MDKLVRLSALVELLGLLLGLVWEWAVAFLELSCPITVHDVKVTGRCKVSGHGEECTRSGAVPGKPCPEEVDSSGVDTRVLCAKRAVFSARQPPRSAGLQSCLM